VQMSGAGSTQSANNVTGNQETGEKLTSLISLTSTLDLNLKRTI